MFLSLFLIFCIKTILINSFYLDNSAVFLPSTIAQQNSNLIYKKFNINRDFSSQNPRFCVFLCLKYDACTSFYIVGGACVFGLSYDVTAFANGDYVTPDANAPLKIKGLSF